jgi:hypothetical protein
MAYIQHLRRTQGKESLELDEDLGFEEASRVISNLTGKSLNSDQGRSVKINEPRLGMAMKECYRHFRNYRRDILGTHREWFKDNVIKTYQLFTEIAQELEQSNQMEA